MGVGFDPMGIEMVSLVNDSNELRFGQGLLPNRYTKIRQNLRQASVNDCSLLFSPVLGEPAA